MSEQHVQQAIRLALGTRPDVTLWRNNCGKLPDPRTNRWVEFGVANPGGSDLIGLRTVTIGPEHIGRTMAVFSACEVKTPTGRVRPEQQRFIDFVRSRGGIAGIARSVEDAQRLFS
jgi:VRR-NUC domain